MFAPLQATLRFAVVKSLRCIVSDGLQVASIDTWHRVVVCVKLDAVRVASGGPLENRALAVLLVYHAFLHFEVRRECLTRVQGLRVRIPRCQVAQRRDEDGIVQRNHFLAERGNAGMEVFVLFRKMAKVDRRKEQNDEKVCRVRAHGLNVLVESLKACVQCTDINFSFRSAVTLSTEPTLTAGRQIVDRMRVVVVQSISTKGVDGPNQIKGRLETLSV